MFKIILSTFIKAMSVYKIKDIMTKVKNPTGVIAIKAFLTIMA
jgi:hypothetical protein